MSDISKNSRNRRNKNKNKVFHSQSNEHAETPEKKINFGFLISPDLVKNQTKESISDTPTKVEKSSDVPNVKKNKNTNKFKEYVSTVESKPISAEPKNKKGEKNSVSPAENKLNKNIPTHTVNKTAEKPVQPLTSIEPHRNREKNAFAEYKPRKQYSEQASKNKFSEYVPHYENHSYFSDQKNEKAIKKSQNKVSSTVREGSTRNHRSHNRSRSYQSQVDKNELEYNRKLLKAYLDKVNQEEIAKEKLKTNPSAFLEEVQGQIQQQLSSDGQSPEHIAGIPNMWELYNSIAAQSNRNYNFSEASPAPMPLIPKPEPVFKPESEFDSLSSQRTRDINSNQDNMHYQTLLDNSKILMELLEEYSDSYEYYD